jgi:hypothetical protein
MKERGPERLDAVGGEERGQQHAEGQEVGALHRQHGHHLGGDGSRDLLGPGVEHQMHGGVREGFGAQEARQRGGEDQEGEQRHQRGNGEVARHRPAVVVVEMADGVGQHPLHGHQPPHLASLDAQPVAAGTARAENSLAEAGGKSRPDAFGDLKHHGVLLGFSTFGGWKTF